MTQEKDEHIVTAEEPSWTEQRHRPDEDGKPEVVPDSLILHPLEIGPEPMYSCSCGAELRSWGDVRKHFEKVVNSPESVPDAKSATSQEISSNQATLDDI